MRQGGNEDLLTSHSLRLNGASDGISKAAHMRESSGVENKLSNHNFTKNAPKSVIEIEEKKKRDTVVKINSLKKELNTFNESK